MIDTILGFPVIKNRPVNAGEGGLNSGSGRFSPGEGNGNPLQFSCLENPMNRGAWWVTMHGVLKESDIILIPKPDKDATKK